MDIEEMKVKKKKLEILIKDGINTFMKETKVMVSDIDIGMFEIRGGEDAPIKIRAVSLSIEV